MLISPHRNKHHAQPIKGHMRALQSFHGNRDGNQTLMKTKENRSTFRNNPFKLTFASFGLAFHPLAMRTLTPLFRPYAITRI